MDLNKLRGILPVIPTPFTEDGRVDLDGIERVADFCIEAGSAGLVFPGVASEYDFLTVAERLSLLERICRVAAGRVPVICGAGKGDAGQLAENIRQSAALGVVAAMVLVPVKFQNDVEGARAFMGEIIKLAPGVPIILQNAPTPIGAGLSVADVVKLVDAFDAIRFVKEEGLPSGPRITGISERSKGNLIGVIGGGGSRYLIDEMARGAVAAMPAAEITDLHVRMWNAYQGGDVAKARDLYMRTLPLLVIQVIYRMRLTKWVLAKRGLLTNSTVRAPLPEFDEMDVVELNAQLDSLNELFTLARQEPVKS